MGTLLGSHMSTEYIKNKNKKRSHSRVEDLVILLGLRDRPLPDSIGCNRFLFCNL